MIDRARQRVTEPNVGIAPVPAAIPHSAWLVWFPFALGLLFAVLWVRAITSLIAAWSDPSAKILRFCALILLIPFAAVAVEFLLVPFR
jgi:hypothetical protein